MKVFKETQRFDQWWLRVLLLAVMLVMTYSFFSGFMDASEKETPLSLGSAVAYLFGMVLLIFFAFFLKLETKIDEQGIYYAFWPFRRSLKLLPWNTFKKCYVRQYSPISEYGGWGYRLGFGRSSGAINVKGNMGIQLEFKNGKKLLIGTQKEKEAMSVIATYKHKLTV